MAAITDNIDTIAGTGKAIAGTMSEVKKKQGNIQNRIRIAICSEQRRSIIDALWERKKGLSALRKELAVSSTSAIHTLRDLEKNKIVFEDEDRNYGLTKIGEIIALKLVDMVDTLEVLHKHDEFWLTHDLSGIPTHLMEKIGWLKDSMIIADTPADFFKSHTTLLQVLENANELKGIYPIFQLDYLEKVEELVRSQRIDVELIVTNEVLDNIVGMAETEESFKIFLQEPNFTLFALEEDLKIALTLTDSAFYLGLFAGSGIYDYNKALISDDKRALSWGRELYAHYHQRSKVVDLWT
ncbi:MAG: transcriptional regulator FilR1 domain-containing protein [Halobacteriota archaeon]